MRGMSHKSVDPTCLDPPFDSNMVYEVVVSNSTIGTVTYGMTDRFNLARAHAKTVPAASSGSHLQ